MKKDEQREPDLDAYTQQLIRQVESEGLLKAPVHMKQEILERSRRVDYQMNVQTRKLSRNMQLFFYSLKVGTAVVAALFLLFTIPRELPQVEVPLREIPRREREERVSYRLNEGLGRFNQMLSEMMWSESE